MKSLAATEAFTLLVQVASFATLILMLYVMDQICHPLNSFWKKFDEDLLIDTSHGALRYVSYVLKNENERKAVTFVAAARKDANRIIVHLLSNLTRQDDEMTEGEP